MNSKGYAQTHDKIVQVMKRDIAERGIMHFLVFVVVLVTLVHSFGIIDTMHVQTWWWRAFVVTSLLVLTYTSSKRDTWLPFLGKTVIPPSAFIHQIPVNASERITLPVHKDAVSVVYWGAETENAAQPGDDPMTSYYPWTNAGVVPVSNASATFHFRCPRKYKVRGKILPKHIHFREIFSNGVLGHVKTFNVTC